MDSNTLGLMTVQPAQKISSKSVLLISSSPSNACNTNLLNVNGAPDNPWASATYSKCPFGVLNVSIVGGHLNVAENRDPYFYAQ